MVLAAGREFQVMVVASRAARGGAMNAGRYPFLSKREIRQGLDAGSAFAIDCVAIMHERTRRRVAGEAKSGGWMSSETAVAIRLAASACERTVARSWPSVRSTRA